MDHDRESAIDYLADNYEFEIDFKEGKIRTEGGIRSLPMPLADLKAAVLEGGEEAEKEIFKRYYLGDWPTSALIEKWTFSFCLGLIKDRGRPNNILPISPDGYVWPIFVVDRCGRACFSATSELRKVLI